MNRLMLALTLGFVLITTGCQSAYYETMEKFGVHKRDILVDRVESARESQEDAREQFQSALEQFRQVVNFDGGSLEQQYNKLSSELDQSESRAAAVSSRIKSVRDVAEALFREWAVELEQYNNPELRRDSQRKLDQTRQRYDRLITAMQQAESRIEPVLKPMRDQVLYLKHNLNAQAISSLQGELRGIETDVETLVRAINAAITEADSFIRTLDN